MMTVVNAGSAILLRLPDGRQIAGHVDPRTFDFVADDVDPSTFTD
jgi:hypothetical protein